MKAHIPVLLLAVARLSVSTFTTSAHPSSGIVVDQQGNVFFSDIDRGVLKIDAHGTVTTIFPREGGHWLALDSNGSFSKVDFEKSSHWPRWFKRRTAIGVRPTLLSDGGSPLVVAPNGNLYYVCNDDQMIPGGLIIARLTPDGKQTLLNSAFRHTSDELGGIKGLAVGPGGSLYASYPKAILKFALDGKVTTLLNPVVVADCDKEPSSTGDAPSLRGLAVDARGTVYAAATGCRCVLKITPDGHVETAIKAQAPWSPTGVALRGDDLFILEYNVINDAAHKYVPRVRRLGHDGKVATLATFAPEKR
jgi:sugar lactone lactonase YvrE